MRAGLRTSGTIRNRMLRVAGAAAALAGLLVAGCDRETRPQQSTAETAPMAVALSDLYPGRPPPLVSDPRGKTYEGNAAHIAAGQRYYEWFNCKGCHFNGGGGIGPALMDDKWRYGGEIEQVYASIDQ